MCGSSFTVLATAATLLSFEAVSGRQFHLLTVKYEAALTPTTFFKSLEKVQCVLIKLLHCKDITQSYSACLKLPFYEK